jgi:hypothetical protein
LKSSAGTNQPNVELHDPFELADPSPDLMKAFREDEVTLDRMQALAVADDHSVSRPHRSPTVHFSQHPPINRF